MVIIFEINNKNLELEIIGRQSFYLYYYSSDFNVTFVIQYTINTVTVTVQSCSYFISL